MRRRLLLVSAIGAACLLAAQGAVVVAYLFTPLLPAYQGGIATYTLLGFFSSLLSLVSSLGWIAGILLSIVAVPMGLAYTARRRGHLWSAAIGGSCVLALVAFGNWLYSLFTFTYTMGSVFTPITWLAIPLLLSVVSVLRLDAHKVVIPSDQSSPVSRRARPSKALGNVDAVEAGLVNVALIAAPHVTQSTRDLAVARFVTRYGAGRVMLIPPNTPVEHPLDWCDVFVPLIDPATMEALHSASPEEAAVALPDERAFLAQLLTANQSGKLLIPILVDGAVMPRPSALPAVYRFIARRNALTLTNDAPSEQLLTPLASAIKAQLGERRPDPIALWGGLGVAIWMLGALLIAVFETSPNLGRASAPDALQPLYRMLLIALAPLPLLVLYVGVRMAIQRLWERLATFSLFTLMAASCAVVLIWIVPSAGYFNGNILPATVTIVLAVVIVLLLLSVAIYSYARGDARFATPMGLQRPAMKPQRTDVTAVPGRVTGHYFLSYRRVDTGAECDRLYRLLTSQRRRYRAFRDLNSILAGADFLTVLDEALDNCSAVLALIGPDWLNVRDAHGAVRLYDPDDVVHQEIAAALRKGKPVIPVLIRGATLPRAKELPPDLAALEQLTPIRYNAGSVFALEEHLRSVLRLPPMRMAVLIGLAMWTTILDIVWLAIHPWLLFTAALTAVRAVSGQLNCQVLGSVCAYSTPDRVTLFVLFGLQAVVLALVTTAWFLYVRFLLQEGLQRRAAAVSVLMLLTATAVTLFVALWYGSSGVPTTGVIGTYLCAVAAILTQGATLGYQVNGYSAPRLQLRAQRAKA